MEFIRREWTAPRCAAVKDKAAAKAWALKQGCCVSCGTTQNLSVETGAIIGITSS